MIKVLYKPMSLLLGVLAGVLASSALQGAIFAVVKAAISRGGAQGVEKATGTWPGPSEAEAA